MLKVCFMKKFELYPKNYLPLGNSTIYPFLILKQRVELAWRSGSVMDGHATARGSIPGGNGIKTELHVHRKGQ